MTTQETVQALLAQARRHVEGGDADAALRLLRQAAALAPAAAAIHHDIGYLQLGWGRFAPAARW